MTTIATIVQPGVETTIQDKGRAHYRHFGAPQSGAADRLSFAIANAAAGNPWDAAALECTALGPEMRFEAEVEFALGGADMNATLNDKPVPLYSVQRATAGDTLKLRAAKTGLRAYIAISGGICGRQDLGSVSTYTPAGLGGVAGRVLKTGDKIERAETPSGAVAAVPASATPGIANDAILRVVRGPEFHLLDALAQKQFLSESFTVSRRANRMGFELAGCAICPPQDFSMLSSPVFPGTVQCPPSGNPFLLLADAQTVGGYPRIAQIIDADLHLAAQMRPGAKVWFSAVSPSEARDTTAQQTVYYRAYLPGFRFA